MSDEIVYGDHPNNPLVINLLRESCLWMAEMALHNRLSSPEFSLCKGMMAECFIFLERVNEKPS